MKRHSLSVLLLAASAQAAIAAPMGSMPCDETTTPGAWRQPAAFAPRGDAGPSIDFRKQVALVALRKEGLDLQKSDGGVLTEVHRSLLQAKLNAIQRGQY